MGLYIFVTEIVFINAILGDTWEFKINYVNEAKQWIID